MSKKLCPTSLDTGANPALRPLISVKVEDSPTPRRLNCADALQIVLLRGKKGTRVGGQAAQNIHGLGGADRLEQSCIKRLHRRASFVHDAPLDQRADDHDLLHHGLACLEVILVLRKHR